MSQLLHSPPFGPRNDAAFLEEMNRLTRWHWDGCAEYRLIWPAWSESNFTSQLPFLHVGIFKSMLVRTLHAGVQHRRILSSSSTSAAAPSRIVLDDRSSALHLQSTLAIQKQIVGPESRPLLVLDSTKSMRQRGELSARIAAAMSLKPLASELHFLLDDPADPTSVRWDVVSNVLERHRDIIIYGFTWILWTAWADANIPTAVRTALSGTRIHFVHSGGWKKLESLRIDRARFDSALLTDLSPQSRVIDFYGLVEQVGILYPLCSEGFRHVPCWADAIVRDPWTLEPISGKMGVLQLMNTLTYGAPYHSVLTEDLGQLVDGECLCGMAGRRFELLGRVPQAELRGCANV